MTSVMVAPSGADPTPSSDSVTVLKVLLKQRHWQTYSAFVRAYDRAAKDIDEKDLVGSAPVRGQLYRWVSGQVKKLPYPHHCRVLEAMFPGWTAVELFEPAALFEEIGPRIPEHHKPMGPRPPRLSFAGVCIWCERRECRSGQCVRRHELTCWQVCPVCNGAPWTRPGGCTCLYGLAEAAKFVTTTAGSRR